MTDDEKNSTPENAQEQAQRPEIDPHKVQIRTGALAPLLAEQLGVEPERVKHFQEDMDALHRLRIRGIIPGKAAHKSEIKVLNNMVKELTGKPGKFKANW